MEENNLDYAYRAIALESPAGGGAGLGPGSHQKNRQKMLENRQRQLASLQRMEEKIRKSARASSSHNNTGGNSPQPKQPSNTTTSCPHHKMTTFILDISTAVSDNYVTWLPVTPISSSEAPQESILYR